MASRPYRQPCARTLDRPIVIFGLEPEDLVGVGLAAIALMFATDGLIGVGAGLASWIALVRLKAGRPPGYLFYLAYRTGLVDLLPGGWKPAQILPRRVRTLSPFSGETDDALACGWWSARPAPTLEGPGGGVAAGRGEPAAPSGGRRGVAGGGVFGGVFRLARRAAGRGAANKGDA